MSLEGDKRLPVALAVSADSADGRLIEVETRYPWLPRTYVRLLKQHTQVVPLVQFTRAQQCLLFDVPLDVAPKQVGDGVAGGGRVARAWVHETMRPAFLLVAWHPPWWVA